mgnify:CR=1 FL=1
MHKLENLEVYRLSMDLGDKVWNISQQWDYFSKSTLGNQIVRAADSISLNIAEGYGRYHHKELRQFCFISRGSTLETKSCLEKALKRNLINKKDYDVLFNDAIRILVMLNSFIKSIEKKDFL